MNKLLIILILEFIILIGYIITIVEVNILNSTLTEDGFSFLSSIGKNWQDGPVNDVYVNADNICYQGDTSLIKDKWLGTRLTCGIKGGLTINCRKYSRRYLPIDPQDIQSWRGTVVCAKRLPGTYLDQKIVRNEKDCNSSWKSCGVLDSSNNILCIKENQECPFNNLQVSPSSSPSPENFKKSIKLIDADMYFTYESGNGKPINEFLIEEDTPCSNPYYHNYKQKPFIAEKTYDRDVCYLDKDHKDIIDTDKQAKIKDSYSFFKVYEENGINKLLKDLPGYDEYSKNITSRYLNLYEREYQGISIRCLDMIQEKGLTSSIVDDLVKFEGIMNGWQGRIKVTKILCWVISIMSLVYFIIMGLLHFYEGIEENENKSRWIISSVPAVMNIVVLYKILTMAIKIGSAGTSFSLLAQENCIDSSTTEYINNALNVMTIYKAALTMSWVPAMISLIVHGVYFLISFGLILK